MPAIGLGVDHIFEGRVSSQTQNVSEGVLKGRVCIERLLSI